ncbi:zinc finger and BTB domain-containing protein 17-like isoform X2 [Gadus macrocephalus]|uniref:zinc finger and BTB domain-containing protein 17-like isoform X2 n=1 Tax=Gadus macrocephalus TaxID=80720 RepID=UPI0028CB62C4|nr:zinc finger and BTB domain-containing protein 17-like isoform X2 [Gadus macrocephalus]
MVNYCMVPRCTNKTRKGRAVSFHNLPRDSERCKQWLRMINHPKIGEDIEAIKQQKVCSIHFKPEDFEFNALGMKRAALLNTAIPSIFTFPDQDEQPGTSGTSGGKRICLKTRRTSAAALLSSSEDDVELQSAPMLSTPGMNLPAVQAQFSPCPSAPGLNTSASILEVGETVKSPKLSSSEDKGVCQMCGQPTSSEIIFDSGRRTVKWMCLGGHSGTCATSPDLTEEPETAPCVESCPELTFDLSEFNFDEENNGSNEEGEEAEVENNSPSEEEEEEEDEEEKDDCDSDWQSHDSDRLSEDSGESGSGESGSDSESELPKNKKTRELCPECGAFFYTSKAHTCEYKIKPFSCNDCGKRCVDANSLKLHSAIHKESYKHLCKFCLAPFKTKLDKHAHEEAHAPCYKPYKCPDCSEAFTKILARNQHLKGHRGPKRYTCPHCPMEFRNENHMERHIVVHTGMRQHVCEFCSRSFNQPGHLKSHLRVHTGEKPFQCQHCDKSFNHNVSLKSHVVRYHKEGASDPSGPAPRSNRTLRETLGRPKGRPKRNAATSAVPVVQGEAPDPTTTTTTAAAEASGKGWFRRDSSEDIDGDSDWSDGDPSPELTEEDKREGSKEVSKSKRKASQRSKTDYIVEKDSESDADSDHEEEAKKRKCVKSQET